LTYLPLTHNLNGTIMGILGHLLLWHKVFHFHLWIGVFMFAIHGALNGITVEIAFVMDCESML